MESYVMNKFLSLLASSVIMIAASNAANAQTYNPLGTTNFTGLVTATVGTTMNCSINVELDVSSTTAASISGFSLAGGPFGACALASITNLPSPVTFTAPNQMTAYIIASTFAGTACQGNILVTYDNVAQVLTIPNQTIGTGSSTCTFRGSAKPNHTFTL